MTVGGKIRLSITLSAWLGGVASIPTSVLLALSGLTYVPLKVLAAYYSFRFLFPAKFWPRFVNFIDLMKHPYFKSQKLVFDSEKAKFPEARSKTLFAVSPHGIIGTGFQCLLTCAQVQASCVRWLAADVLSYLPFVSDTNAWGNVFGCGKANMVDFMRRGENIGIIPGGFHEASLYKRDCHRAVLSHKTGFIKYALQYGYKISPVYVFGEEKTVWKLDLFPKRFAMWLNKRNIPATVFFGKYGFLPDDDIDMTIVIGDPLQFPTIENPSVEQVKQFHAKYVDALVCLFDKHKEANGVPADVKLEIL